MLLIGSRTPKRVAAFVAIAAISICSLYHVEPSNEPPSSRREEKRWRHVYFMAGCFSPSPSGPVGRSKED